MWSPGGERGGYYQSWAVKSRPREARVRGNEDRTEEEDFYPPVLAVALVEGAFLDICPDTC